MDFSCPFFDDMEDLRLLGQQDRASQRLQEAATLDPGDCNLHIHWAEQCRREGQLIDAKSHIERCKALAAEQGIDDLRRALIDMMAIRIDYYMIGTSKEAAALANSLFEQHLRGRSVDGYDAVALKLLKAFYGVRHQLSISSDQRYVAAPRLGTSFFSSLYRRLMQQGRFPDALTFVNLYEWDDDDAESTDTTQADLLKDFLTWPSVSVPVRALCFESRASEMRYAKPRQEWLPLYREAMLLYQSVGNVPWANHKRLILMTESGERLDPHEVIQDFLDMHQVAEAHGCLMLAARALWALEDAYYEARIEMPSELAADVTGRLQRLRDRSGNAVLQLNRLNSTLSKWIILGHHEGKLLQSLEEVHQQAKEMRLTMQIASSATTLHDTYERLGERLEAQAVLERLPDDIPDDVLRVFRLDHFYNSVRRATDVPDSAKAFEELCQQIEAVEIHVSGMRDVSNHNVEIKRFQELQLFYAQIAVADANFNPSAFVVKCGEAVLSLCRYLPEEDSDYISYFTNNNEAHLHLKTATLIMTRTRGNMSMEAVREAQAENEIALNLFLEAAGSRHCSRSPVNKAISCNMLAKCYRSRWLFQLWPRQSDDFGQADLYLRLGIELSRGWGHVRGIGVAMSALLELWKEGVDKNIDVSGLDAAEILLEVCQELDELSMLQRADRSALKSLQALAAKQALSEDDSIYKTFEAALDTLAKGSDTARLWSWVQRSKARSVSDMLALGIKIPAGLSSAIDKDRHLGQILEEEQTLLQKLEESQGSSFDLRRDLETLRKTMRQNPLLASVLAFREGRPTSLEALKNISSQSKAQLPEAETNRRTVFVDWFIYRNSDIYCMLVTDEEGATVQCEQTGLDLSQMQQWRNKYFEQAEDDESHNLFLDGAAALAQLSGLIQLVVKNSSEGDLLVFCPVSILHGIPLHAAFVDGDGERSLIERNPVLYSSSMTTFEHCTSRQLDAPAPGKSAVQDSFLAVFESLESGALDDLGEAQRDYIYTSFQSRAEKFPGSSLALGRDVSEERISEAFQADFTTFLGHCSFEPQNYLHQGLVLAKRSDSDESTVPALFTVSEIFNSTIKASNVMLMACGSAMQSHGQGDEPLGITTALLCSGASSVTGTLWKTRVGTALTFSNTFSMALSRERQNSQSEILDVARMVQATVCRLKNRPDTRSPLQWANFVLYGSWFAKRRVHE